MFKYFKRRARDRNILGGEPLQNQLEQLERQRPENTIRCPMITHIIDLYRIPFIPSQNYVERERMITNPLI